MVGKRSKSGKGIGMGKAEYDYNDNLKMKRQSRTVKAGLQFSVPRIHRKLKQGRYAKCIKSAAPVYLAAVLEYLIAEVLELSGNAARENKKRRIIPRYLQLAIRNDAELDKLLGSVIVSEGGVVPHIMPQLLHTTRSKAKSQRSQEV